MSVQQEHATSETATLTTTESGGVYQSLFDKINLTPVSSIQEIDSWQNSETLADASPDERVTAAIHVLLSCLAKSGEDVVKLDKACWIFISTIWIRKSVNSLMQSCTIRNSRKSSRSGAAHGSSYSALIFAKCQN